MLELKTSYQNGILNIEMHGALDSLTAPDFKFWLTQKCSHGYHYFALNGRNLEFISSRGIGILTELNNILNSGEVRFILYQISDEVSKLLNFLKISDTLPIVENFKNVTDKFGDKPAQKLAPEEKKVTEESQKEKTVETPVEEKNYVGIAASTELNSQSTHEKEKTNSHSNAHTTTEAAVQNLSDINDAETEEEYIDLSKVPNPGLKYDNAEVNVIFCPNCGQNLRVSKKGLYLCPDCRTKFQYPF